MEIAVWKLSQSLKQVLSNIFLDWRERGDRLWKLVVLGIANENLLNITYGFPAFVSRGQKPEIRLCSGKNLVEVLPLERWLLKQISTEYVPVGAHK